MSMKFNIPDSGKQLFVVGQLDQLRETVLSQALADAVRRIDPQILRAEIAEYAPADGLAKLHGTKVRDEEVFATPCVLRRKPTLIGYYRLLLGTSQKQFYKTAGGLNIFKSMEMRGVISAQAEAHITEFCTQYNRVVTSLIREISQTSMRSNITDLPLVTLGAQVDGAWRTRIGTNATKIVFEALKDVVRSTDRTIVEDTDSISAINAVGRKITVKLSSDPDVVITEDMGQDMSVYVVAIEIKGGQDYANIHNRVGEAEKSHQKAKANGAGQCWTIISLEGADMAKLHEESPSTSHWFDFAQVQAHNGSNWNELVVRLKSAMSI